MFRPLISRFLAKTDIDKNYNYTLVDSKIRLVETGGESSISLRETNKFATIGIGWKFKPNLTTQYLLSIDQTPYSRRVPSHTLILRYTFDLKITNEK